VVWVLGRIGGVLGHLGGVCFSSQNQRKSNILVSRHPIATVRYLILFVKIWRSPQKNSGRSSVEANYLDLRKRCLQDVLRSVVAWKRASGARFRWASSGLIKKKKKVRNMIHIYTDRDWLTTGDLKVVGVLKRLVNL